MHGARGGGGGGYYGGLAGAYLAGWNHGGGFGGSGYISSQLSFTESDQVTGDTPSLSQNALGFVSGIADGADSNTNSGQGGHGRVVITLMDKSDSSVIKEYAYSYTGSVQSFDVSQVNADIP